MILLKLTWKSLWNRRISLILTVFSIAISVALLIGVEYINKEAKNSFLNTVSGTDLVVGARSGPVQLLLYSVFHIGNATNNISWKSYQAIAKNKYVKWTIPLSLGDSHKGFRVVGTNQDFFRHYQYGEKQALQFSSGKPFADVYDAVLGASVANKLGYKVGDKIVVAHGGGSTSFSLHKDKPFTVTGILKPTGTPVDQSVLVTLEGIEAIHIDWRNGAPTGIKISAEKAKKLDLSPKLITAFLVGMKNRITSFKVQRKINNYPHEALLAILPGVALADLWHTMGQFETVLRIITVFVVIAGLLGMLTSIISTLNERRREMAILRATGAHPSQIFLLFVMEAFILAFLGALLGMLIVFIAVLIAKPWFLSHYGFHLHIWSPSLMDAIILLLVIAFAVIFSLLPAWIAYRRSLQDGLTVKL